MRYIHSQVREAVGQLNYKPYPHWTVQLRFCRNIVDAQEQRRERVDRETHAGVDQHRRSADEYVVVDTRCTTGAAAPASIYFEGGRHAAQGGAGGMVPAGQRQSFKVRFEFETRDQP